MQDQSKKNHIQLTEIDTQVLEEIAVRFLINLPPHHLDSAEDLSVILTEAFWYFTDIYVDSNKINRKNSHIYSQSSAALKTNFVNGIFSLVPPLRSVDKHTVITTMNNLYKNIPVCGSLIFDETLTKIFVQSSGKGYGIPKGKVAQNERKIDTALRETLEETGWDVSPYIHPNIYFSDGGKATYFLVTGFPIQESNPLLRGEISSSKWINFSDIQKYPIPKSLQKILPLVHQEIEKLKKTK